MKIPQFLENVFSYIFVGNNLNLDALLNHAKAEHEKLGRGVLWANCQAAYEAYLKEETIQGQIITAYIPIENIPQSTKEQSEILARYSRAYVPDSSFIFVAAIRDESGEYFKAYLFESSEPKKLKIDDKIQ